MSPPDCNRARTLLIFKSASDVDLEQEERKPLPCVLALCRTASPTYSLASADIALQKAKAT